MQPIERLSEALRLTIIAGRLQTTIQAVSTWRRRYAAYRMADLTDAPRAGRPRTMQDDQVQAIVDKVRDVVGLYLAPPDRALVLCLDEKSQIQALDRTQPGAADDPR